MTDGATDTSTGRRVAYARCSTEKQDLRTQKAELGKLGYDRIYTDEGFTGTKRDSRQGLDQALAAVREGDTLVVTKLDRLARSVPDALSIAEDLEQRSVRVQLGATVYDPTDPMGRMFFQMLAVFAEFEANMTKMRTREGMAEARRAGRLRGKQTKFTPAQDREIRRMKQSGDYTAAEIAALFNTSRTSIYRSLDRSAATQPATRDHGDAAPVSRQASVPAPVEHERHQGPVQHPEPADTDSAGEPRAIGPSERLDPDTATTERNEITGSHRVLATAGDGESVVVGFLTRSGRQWHAHGPHMTNVPGHWRTKNEALLHLIERHVPSQLSAPSGQ